MKVIAITGMPGSGKKTIREELEKRGFPVLVMRHIVEDELRQKGIEPTNTSLREYATELRKKYGYAVVAERSLIKLRQMDSRVVVLDGIRGDMEVELFRRQKDIDFVLAAAIAPAAARFERLKKRGLEWDMKTKKEFDYRDNKELSWGLGKAIEMADCKIENEGTIDEFRQRIKKAVEKILRQP